MRPGGAWETRLAPLLVEHLRAKRRGQAGQSWYIDETSIRVKGKWWYLYRAIDADGNLVDSRLSEKRDMEAAQIFFKQVLAVDWTSSGTGNNGWAHFLSKSST